MEPLISVIIPSHNSAKTIRTALTSILDQTYKNVEVLVIDDNSTDETQGVVEEVQKDDPRVTYYHLPWTDPKRIDWRGVNINAGYMARNFGFEKARGEWITFQDADDACLKNRIEIQYKMAQKYDAIFVTTGWQQFNESLLGKKFDIDAFLKDEPENSYMTDAASIAALAKKTKGILMGRWFPHNYIPFEFKWFPLTRKLFFNRLDSYPAAGNTPLFKKEVTEKVKFRQLNKRIWPALSGRGADRDFCFQVAETFGRSYAFDLGLYLWRAGSQYEHVEKLKKYIK